MDKEITINGTVYNVKDLDFTNTMCEMEEQGIDVIGIMSGTNKQYISICRGLVSVITGLPAQSAGKLFTRHLANGGKLDEMLDIVSELMSEAGFKATETEDGM